MCQDDASSCRGTLLSSIHALIGSEALNNGFQYTTSNQIFVYILLCVWLSGINNNEVPEFFLYFIQWNGMLI